MTDVCEACAEALDDERLRVAPLDRLCLACLSSGERRALEHDLLSAARIQANLLPARNFSFGRWQINYHYQPLGAVSGDHIDLIRPDRTGEALHFLFGDVSGKGVAASILMANLQALFRSLVSQELPLPVIVGRANRIFAASTGSASFATLVAGRLGSDGGVEIVNAGHNPPLLVRPGAVTPLPAGALPLGFAPGTRFTATHHELGPDDFLFLYTDGVSEAVDSRGEEYGEARLSGPLPGLHGEPARAVVDAVLGDVNSYQNGTPRSDDATAMCLRWRGDRSRDYSKSATNSA